MLPPPRSLFAATVTVLVLICVASIAPGADSGGFAVGVNCAKSPTWAEDCRRLGVKVGRVEWDISTSPSSMDSLMSTYASKGIKVQLLAGFYGRVPTVQEAQNLRTWALRYGPGGTFWQGRSDGNLAVTHIEFGNETSYPYQFGEGGSWWTLSSYTNRARTYALRVKDASLALQGTGVGLLVQAEDAGSATSTWVDNMVAAVPDLSSYTAGWTIHPYGPNGSARIDRMLGYLAAKGLPTSIPIYITEWGLASDNGRTLSNNYGYPTNMTYADAATMLRNVFASWRSSYGSRLAQVIIYHSADLADPGTSTDREMYFGIFKKDTTDKGAYTTEVRAQIGSNSSTPTTNTAPVAKASANVTSGTAPLAVNFSSSGSSDADGSITAYAWDLDGDGQFDDSTAQNPSYTYSNVGTYSVKLRVTDNQGAQDVSDPVVVAADLSSVTGSVEKAKGKPTTASSSENSTFAPDYGNDGTLATRWSSLFADNQWWQVDLGSIRAVSSASITFNQWAWPKTYTVSTSTDGTSWTVVATESLSAPGTKTSAFAGRSARYVRITGVTRGTSAGTSIEEARIYGPSDTTNTAPVAKASANVTSGTAPLAVNFSSAGSSDADGSITAYAWDLDGDGQFDDSTAQNPSYTYSNVGTYSVKLRVTDNQGAQDVSDPVVITTSGSTPSPTTNTAPVAKASANVTSGTAPLAVNFSSAGSSDADGSITAYAWDLDGDGQFDDSTAQNPSYTYSNVGTYSVKLRVTDNQGAQDVSDPVVITTSGSTPSPTTNTAPVAKASANVTSGTAPLAVNFSSAGSSDADGSITAYAWDLDGDGQFDDSTAQNPSYTYSNVGTYSVKLRVTDNQGAQSVSNTIQITAAPAPAPVQLVDVWVLDVGKFEARVIQVLRDVFGLDQNEAKDLVEQAPVIVKRGMARADAEKLKAKLVELGAKVELR